MKQLSYIWQKCTSLVALLLFVLYIQAQDQSPFRACYHANETRQLNIALSHSDTIPLLGQGAIYGLSIDATIYQPREASFTRIVLEDTNGHDYIVAESDWFRNDTTIVNLTEYCEETAKLRGVVPARLKCYLAADATIYISGIHFSNQAPDLSQVLNDKSNRELKRAQVKNIVDRINAYNERHGKLWKADVTDYAMEDFQAQKESEFTKRVDVDDAYLSNIKYYIGGFYEIGERHNRDTTITSQYVPSFRWDRRHGRNWMTPPKDQDSSMWCVPFATCSVLEALVNLQFNQLLQYDLSEWDIAYNNNKQDYRETTLLGNGLIAARNYGVIDEASLSFGSIQLNTDSTIQNWPSYRPYGNENVKISAYVDYNIWGGGTEELKNILIHHGPCVSSYPGHAMALIGYDKITLDDVYTFSDSDSIRENQSYTALVDEEYWVFKDSHYQAPDPNPDPRYGTHPGYLNVVFHDISTFNHAFYVVGTITTRNLTTDDVICEDLDGDGYFNWGIGNKPAHCPTWAAEEPDGDDSDYSKGPMTPFGFIPEINVDSISVTSISGNETYSSKKYFHGHIIIQQGAQLIIQNEVQCYDGVKLTIKNGATLYVDGGSLRNVHLIVEQGGHIIIDNGGEIECNINHPFTIPVGAQLDIVEGRVK